MLKETATAGQRTGNSRRWFSDYYFDLIVWFNQDNQISGFQLCYDKKGQERALTWTKKDGYRHERVDDGETNPAKNLSPVLVPDGICPIEEITGLFLERSAEIDPGLREVVLDRLHGYRIR